MTRALLEQLAALARSADTAYWFRLDHDDVRAELDYALQTVLGAPLEPEDLPTVGGVFAANDDLEAF